MDVQFPIYSPEHEIYDPLFEEKNLRVFIKRDDMIHPFISGNKWRKLKLHIEQAKSQGISQLVTFGGAWSNHILATAAAGAQFQLKTYAFIRGEEVTNPVLSMCKLFGMQLHFVDRESYRNKEALFQQAFPAQEAYFIDEGGRSDLGIEGCVSIYEELKNTYQHIILAAGTGTTAAGLLKAIQSQSNDTQLHVVPVLKLGDSLANDFNTWGLASKNLYLHADYHFGGYAKTKPELLAFIQSFVSKTGIMIEPVYTGKMMYGLYDLIKKDQFKPGSHILAIHTGGLTGFLGMYEQFDALP